MRSKQSLSHWDGLGGFWTDFYYAPRPLPPAAYRMRGRADLRLKNGLSKLGGKLMRLLAYTGLEASFALVSSRRS